MPCREPLAFEKVRGWISYFRTKTGCDSSRIPQTPHLRLHRTRGLSHVDSPISRCNRVLSPAARIPAPPCAARNWEETLRNLPAISTAHNASNHIVPQPVVQKGVHPQAHRTKNRP